jgi:hypothetical protein
MLILNSRKVKMSYVLSSFNVTLSIYPLNFNGANLIVSIVGHDENKPFPENVKIKVGKTESERFVSDTLQGIVHNWIPFQIKVYQNDKVVFTERVLII